MKTNKNLKNRIEKFAAETERSDIDNLNIVYALAHLKAVKIDTEEDFEVVFDNLEANGHILSLDNLNSYTAEDLPKITKRHLKPETIIKKLKDGKFYLLSYYNEKGQHIYNWPIELDNSLNVF